jgi:hypothetical protein
MVRKGAALICMSSTTVLKRGGTASGLLQHRATARAGLEGDDTLELQQPQCLAQRATRPVWYFSSMVRSGAMRSPGLSPSRRLSRTMRWATIIAALGGRVDMPAAREWCWPSHASLQNNGKH